MVFNSKALPFANVFTSRNPCFNGIWFLIEDEDMNDMFLFEVAILVLMEYGF